MKNIKVHFSSFIFLLILGIQIVSAGDDGFSDPFIISSVDDVYTLKSYSDWMFVPNDNISNATQIRSENIGYTWYDINSWQLSNPEFSNYYGASWFGMSFDITDKDYNKTKKIGLYLPVHYGAVQVYLNGDFLYETRAISTENGDSTFGGSPALIEFPAGSLYKKENYLRLRVGSYSGWGGFTGFLKIGSFNKLQKQFSRSIIKNIGIGFTSLFLSIFFLLHYFFRKSEKYYLLLSGLCFFVGLFVVGYSGLWYFLFDYPWAYWILTFIGGINMYLFPILFIHSFFHKNLGVIAKIFIAFYGFLSVFVFSEYLLTKEVFFFVKYLYGIFNLSYIFLVVYFFVIGISFVRKKLEFSGLMLLSIIILGGTFLFSMLSFTQIIMVDPIIGEGFFLMSIAFSIILAKRYSLTHEKLEDSNKRNSELNKTLEYKVETRTAMLKEKNEEIMASIDYAGIILKSSLPVEEELQKIFLDHFVIWKPKDVVGGDFYWSHYNGDDTLFAIADCTGHGVPGALLSMTASSALQRIANHINHDDPAVILNHLNRIMKKTLSQGTISDLSDNGLDIGLCHFNKNNGILTYSGSRIRFYHYNDEEGLNEIRGNRQGVGFRRSMDSYTYNSYELDVTPSSVFYLTTDGYLDQGGGENEFCLGWTRYKEAILQIHSKPMAEQKKHMEQLLKDYGRGYEQRDDITVVGFKVIQE